jgi:hypothetical protein
MICAGTADGLYFSLITSRSNSHRFFIAESLFPGSLQHVSKRAIMFDLLMLAIGLGFFALSIGYAAACDRL